MHVSGILWAFPRVRTLLLTALLVSRRSSGSLSISDVVINLIERQDSFGNDSLDARCCPLLIIPVDRKIIDIIRQ